MVLSPGPVQKFEEVAGSGSVPITNFELRVKDGVVKVEAWRETSDFAKGLVAGQIYYFEGIKKITLKPTESTPNTVVRYQKYTSHDGCSRVLEQQIKETTEDSLLGATMISPGMSARCRLSEHAD